jgi:PAS domain S-box-containing protein
MPTDSHLRRAAGTLGLIVCLFGLVALAAQQLGWAAAGLGPLSAHAAAAMAGLGAALVARAGGWPRAALILPSLTLAGAVFALVLGAIGRNTGASLSTEMALSIMAGSGALLLLGNRAGSARWPLSAWLANVLVAVGAAGILAQEFTNEQDSARPLGLASGFAVAFIALGAGTLLARPEDLHVRILFQKTPAGLLARRFFLGVAVVPLVFSALLGWSINHELIVPRDGILIFVVALVLCGFALALFSIEAATAIDNGREQAEQARLLLTARLQEQAAKLQETVEQRTRELRETNASLRATAESNALLALVAQHSTNGVVITDAHGCVEWVNDAFTTMTGYSLEDAKGRKPGHMLQGPDTSPIVVEQLRVAEQRGEAVRVEILNYTKAGSPFWQIIDMQPVRDRDGRVVNFVANQTDITENRAAKIRLEHLNQRLELATRAAALGVWEWDVVGQRSVWDARTLEIYGLTAAQFDGTLEAWKALLHPEDRDGAVAKVQSVLRSGQTYEHEFRIIRASDGTERYVQSRAIVQRDANGRALRITGTERDITAEHEATLRTRTLNERLQLALRSSQFGVWEYDLHRNRRHWDERVMEIYGVSPEKFDGAMPQWERLLHPEDRERTIDVVQRVVRGEDSDYSTHFRVIRADGKIRHIESHGYLQRDSAGRPMRIVGLTRDVTEEAELEQALDLAEQRWQLAIQGTNDSVWDWNVVTGEVYHDERWARMLGYEADELRSTNEGWKALAHPDDLPANEVAIREHFEQRTTFYQHELRMRAKDGTWRWILDRGRVVRRAADGRPLRMAGTHTDITPRKQLEERLRKTEELANEVSRLAQIGGWEIDLQSSRVTWTEGTRRIHEVDESFQPTIESVWQFFPPDALTTVQSALRDASPAAPSFDIEVGLLTARGRRLRVRILGHGEFHQGRATSVHGAIQDITSRYESEEARRELETQLFQAQKMETLGTLAGGIAHDFNNLLTGIIGYHELAADSLPEDHPARSCLHEARNASLRARELVEQILTFGRQSGGGEHGPIDLSLVVEEARRFLRATLPANITIEVRVAPHCGSVHADATQIHQVILNLGSNAAHAMRHNGGALRIALEPAEVSPDLALTLGGPAASSYVRLSVSDTGHGMDESTRRRIFDPFFTTKNTREGTGLGLAVVHGIVRSHRGAIDVESSPGRGSTFHIYLPTARDTNATTDVETDSAPRGGGEYICVVDDEDVVASCTKLVLENKGYRALTYGSAEHALAELERDPTACAVLITDQTMPGMQGTELAAALRKLNPTLPVVIMSGYFSKISPEALDELGQVELLAKPFTTDELAYAVHRALHPAARPA